MDTTKINSWTGVRLHSDQLWVPLGLNFLLFVYAYVYLSVTYRMLYIVNV